MKKTQAPKQAYSKRDQQVIGILRKVHHHDQRTNEQVPSFVSVLPSFVRYCKDLSAFDKVLYSEISALTNLYGFCYASNNYFASLYNVSVSTIIRSLATLKANKFIYVKSYQDPESNFLYRCIFLGSFDFETIRKNTPNFTNQDLQETFKSERAEELSRLFCMAVFGKETPPDWHK